MTSKKLITTLAVVFSVLVIFTVSPVMTDGDKAAGAPQDSVSDAAPDAAEKPADVVVYYFHTTRRCASCKKIESYTKEAIETGFEKELEDGRLEFHIVNTDKKENKHFEKEYKLYTKSVIVCDLEDGEQTEWKNLEKVWELLRDKDKFVEYVQDGISDYLKDS